MKRAKGNLTPDCLQCEVRPESAFCGMLSEAEVGFFMKAKKDHAYEKGQALFYQGNSCEGIYLLCSGSIKLVKSSDTGQQQILEIISPGDWIDKGSFFSSGRHSATAQALERSDVCFLSGDAVRQLLKSLPGLPMTLIEALSRAVEKGRERTHHLASKSAMARLSEVLVDLGRKHGVKQGRIIRISLLLKREELAEIVGVTQETVVRLLTTLKKKKLIALNGREITILESEKLASLKS
ncbi:MAG: Crp/Fnr family transcriptional regulator [Nitrospiria bacterium]